MHAKLNCEIMHSGKVQSLFFRSAKLYGIKLTARAHYIPDERYRQL